MHLIQHRAPLERVEALRSFRTFRTLVLSHVHVLRLGSGPVRIIDEEHLRGVVRLGSATRVVDRQQARVGRSGRSSSSISSCESGIAPRSSRRPHAFKRQPPRHAAATPAATATQTSSTSVPPGPAPPPPS